jgi:hypothetical protein
MRTGGDISEDAKEASPKRQGNYLISDIALEFIKIIPGVSWVFVAFLAIYWFYYPLLGLFERNQIKSLAIGVFQLELIGLQGPDGEHEVTPNQIGPVAERARRMANKLEGAKLLWVDDKNPEQNAKERKALESLGIQIDLADTTEKALRTINVAGAISYNAIITDMRRDDDRAVECQRKDLTGAGCDLLRRLNSKYGVSMPLTIVYASGYDPAYGAPPFAFGMTNRVDELMHLVLDALERGHQ